MATKATIAAVLGSDGGVQRATDAKVVKEIEELISTRQKAGIELSRKLKKHSLIMKADDDEEKVID